MKTVPIVEVTVKSGPHTLRMTMRKVVVEKRIISGSLSLYDDKGNKVILRGDIQQSKFIGSAEIVEES